MTTLKDRLLYKFFGIEGVNDDTAIFSETGIEVIRNYEKWCDGFSVIERNHGRNCDCNYCDNTGFSNAEMM